jgi:hypothetical protein
MAGAGTYVVVAESEPGPIVDFAARELAKYLGLLCGGEVHVIPVGAWTGREGATPVVIGRAGRHPLLARVVPPTADLAAVGPEGFIQGGSSLGGAPAWFVAGRTEVAVLYGAYALLERAGATFLISGDLLPEPMPGLSLPGGVQTSEPAFERRGFLLPYPLNVQESIWGLADYIRLIDQMAKLRLNYLNLNFTAADPTVEYTFNGERSLIGDINSWETGFMAPRCFFERGRTDQVQVGGEHFAARPFIAPPELQGIRGPEEAHRKLAAMFKAVFEHAGKRGVRIGFAMDPTEIPTNFARFMRRVDRTPARSHFAGTHVDFTDPMFEAHTRAWLSSLFETYPDAVDLFFWNAEGYLDYPEHREMVERYRPKFNEAKRIFEERWMQTSQYVNTKTAQTIIDADIVQMEATLRVIAIARALRPGFTVGFGFLFRGYVLRAVDQIVAKDIPFMDFQSSGVTPIGHDVNAEYFSGMGERVRYIISRMDDDGSMFGMPFYLRQYRRDGLFEKARQAGVTGFVAQMFRGRGSEHHVRFLAQGTWETTLEPEAFYREFAEAAFGPKAAPAMERAFALLEDSEESLGWRSMKSFHFPGGCSEFEVLGAELLAEDNPYDGPDDPQHLSRRAKCRYLAIDSRVPAGEYIPGKIELYRKSISLLTEALSSLREAETVVSAKGSAHLDYLISKTEAYIAHLEMVALAAEAIAAYADAFSERPPDESRLETSLLAAERLLNAAQQKAREAAGKFARKIDHPSDLGILFLANIYNIEKADRLADLFHRVAAYHAGGRYWTDG